MCFWTVCSSEPPAADSENLHLDEGLDIGGDILSTENRKRTVFLLTWLIGICVLIFDHLENSSPNLLLMMSHQRSGWFSNLENGRQLAFI